MRIKDIIINCNDVNSVTDALIELAFDGADPYTAYTIMKAGGVSSKILFQAATIALNRVNKHKTLVN